MVLLRPHWGATYHSKGGTQSMIKSSGARIPEHQSRVTHNKLKHSSLY